MVKLFSCSFCPKQFVRFLLHFPIRVSNQHYKNSVTLKNQCIWSIFRPDSKQCKIGVSAIRGSVFGGFAVCHYHVFHNRSHSRQDLLPVQHCTFFSALMPFEISKVVNKIYLKKQSSIALFQRIQGRHHSVKSKMVSNTTP